ncbi:MAG TPA: hypothetical protein VNY05_37780 [Candidatus Acidoferrales bacterium]|jgi:hypothetical protein|nr:hypothetical protein [Candidatus Acidoferrales bacterium]
MTITLPPEIEAGLLAEAQATGVSVDAVLKDLLAPYAQSVLNHPPLNPEDCARAFREWAKSHRPTPPLSSEAISRKTS